MKVFRSWKKEHVWFKSTTEILMSLKTWWFNIEIDYCISIACFNLVVTVDLNRRIYFKNLNNKESLTNIKCISEESKNIPFMLTMTKVDVTTILIIMYYSLPLIQPIQMTKFSFDSWSTLIALVKSIKRKLEDCL